MSRDPYVVIAKLPLFGRCVWFFRTCETASFVCRALDRVGIESDLKLPRY